jgi:hypothetical protein
MRHLRLQICVALFACLFGSPAYAQLRGKIAVGASVVKFEPASDGLKAKVRVVPTISRVPKPGWGLALGLNWFEADVDGDFVGLGDRLGKLTVRPLMAGIGYTAMSGPLSFNASIIGGPAQNRLKVDDDWTSVFSVGGDDFKSKATVWTFAVRPGVSATYAVGPRFGLTAFAGYLFNRPEFKVRGPIGERDTPWKADGFSVSAGVVVPIYK